jgi:uncharacterized membrane protein (DUF4010 family)
MVAFSRGFGMPEVAASLVNLMVALGAGLLIGAERERRKQEKAVPSLGGIRTFTLASLAGALAFALGGVGLLAVTVAAVTLLAGVSYWRLGGEDDPGLTTEIALVLVVLIGALAMRDAFVAAALSVAVAFLLAARKGVHRFVAAVLTEEEVRAALILAAAAVVVLPLLPNRPMGPFGALNPYSVWRLVVLVLAIGAVGHVAVRALGPRFGMPIAGLASGFVSSSATIAATGAKAAKTPAILGAAVAGAVLSTVATVVQMAAVLAATSLPVLQAMTPALVAGGAAAALYGAVFTLRALRQPADAAEESGNPFSLAAALVFAGALSVILLASAALREWFGESGAVIAAALAGFVDTHSAAISIAAMVASGKMTAADAVLPILAGLTTNTVTKAVLASTTGGRAFAVRVVPGLILVIAVAWAGGLASRVAG